MGFKARQKLITRKRECSARVGRSKAVDCGGVMCVRTEGFLRFIGRVFHKRGEELRGNRYANLSLVKQVEGKDADDLRNGFCWEVCYLRACEGGLVRLYAGWCV